MTKLLRSFLLLFALLLPLGAQAQYTHRATGLPSPTLSTTGTATTLTPANSVCLVTGGVDTIFITLSGAATGATAQFVFTNDLVNYYGLQMQPFSQTTGTTTGAGATSAAYTANTPASFIGQTNGALHVCVYLSAVASLSVTVQIDGDPASNLENVSGSTVSQVAVTTANGFSQGVLTVNTTTGFKAAAGNVYGVSLSNPAATPCFLQFYNSNTPTCGTLVQWSIAVPTTGVTNLVSDIPLGNFTTGIGTCFSTTQTGAVTCTGTIAGTIFFK